MLSFVDNRLTRQQRNLIGCVTSDITLGGKRFLLGVEHEGIQRRHHSIFISGCLARFSLTLYSASMGTPILNKRPASCAIRQAISRPT